MSIAAANAANVTSYGSQATCAPYLSKIHNGA